MNYFSLVLIISVAATMGLARTPHIDQCFARCEQLYNWFLQMCLPRMEEMACLGIAYNNTIDCNFNCMEAAVYTCSNCFLEQ
ncbi:unnamed protein product [Dicrocoelium dendriticum]|nr:unnamed protein product [Dicrocoelium dendriticum]